LIFLRELLDTASEYKPEGEVIELTEMIDGKRWVWVGNLSLDAVTSVIDLVLWQPQPLIKAA